MEKEIESALLTAKVKGKCFVGIDEDCTWLLRGFQRGIRWPARKIKILLLDCILSRSNGGNKKRVSLLVAVLLNCIACCQSNHEFNARTGTGAG